MYKEVYHKRLLCSSFYPWNGQISRLATQNIQEKNGTQEDIPFSRDTSRETDSKISVLHISLFLQFASYGLLTKKGNSFLECLESLPRVSENYSKAFQCPASCFQVGNLFTQAPEVILPPCISEPCSKKVFFHTA